MLIDGNKINEEIKEELRGKIKKPISLAVVWVGDSPVSAKYIEKKKQFGAEIGVSVEVFKYGAGIMTSELVSEIKGILREGFSGIIVQLPLPPQIDTPAVLNAIPLDRDVDLLSDTAYQNFISGVSPILPPVVGSIKEIFERGGIRDLRGKRAVVVGRGKLVGRPVAAWLKNQGAEVVVLAKDDWGGDLSKRSLAEAEIIVAGAGVPGMITPEMVRDGVVIIDAATSDVSGKMIGDICPGCAEKSAVFSPVPGGVGPITVAMLFKNLVALSAMMYHG